MKLHRNTLAFIPLAISLTLAPALCQAKDKIKLSTFRELTTTTNSEDWDNLHCYARSQSLSMPASVSLIFLTPLTDKYELKPVLDAAKWVEGYMSAMDIQNVDWPKGARPTPADWLWENLKTFDTTCQPMRFQTQPFLDYAQRADEIKKQKQE